MSVPAPFVSKEIETTLDSIDMEINSNKTKIKLSYTPSIIKIFIEQINSFPKNEFLLSSSHSELKKINKYFQYFDSTEELIKSLHESIKDKSFQFFISNNICELEIKNPILKSKFKINIPIKEKNINDELSNIIPFIKELNSKIEKLEKENIELTKKVNYLMEKDKNKDKDKYDNLFKESNIIQLENIKLIVKYLPYKPTKTKLLYDSKRDGDTAKAFHSKCDGKFPTIYIIESEKGYKFGGYLSQRWNSENKYVEDNNAFFFSINLQKKYFFNNPKQVYYGNPYYGPVIRGGITMNICDNANSSINNFIYLDNENQGSKYEINGGESNFNLQSYEVYQIE